MTKTVSAKAVSEDDVQKIIALAKDAHVQELSLHEGSMHVRVVLTREAEASRNAPQGFAEVNNLMEVVAPLAAQFLPHHPCHPNSGVRVGQSVRRGDLIGFLLSGPLLTPLVSPCNGVISQLLAEPNMRVGYGTALVSIAKKI
ncbi:Biotin carboxyl carrier protein [Cohaesibacter marisflavi]|uniref:Biotin carboxyl carrier protein n=1 Tax=Cohaesibacter marisflavi TaxID=655353 RepID=A0A1I5M3J5_9HYPH|nr:hypothetical protein [Cohaesibacter marisflavi]SFP04122.1 Biotin carboxyl carrier protein [Cohaesibacter marisflavi]